MPPTGPMIFGSLCHCLILEPREFDGRYAVFKDGKTINSVKGEKFSKENEGKIIISLGDYEHALEMSRAIKVSKILSGVNPNYREVVGFNDIGGVDAKAKLDWYDDGYIWDYKTTSSLEKFEYSFFYYGYDLQAMWYICIFDELPDITGVKLLVQEKNPPYPYMIYEPTYNILKAANQVILDWIPKFKECLEKDIWMPHTIKIEERPTYLKRNY